MIQFGLRADAKLSRWLKKNHYRLLGTLKTAKRKAKRKLAPLPLRGCDYVAGPTGAQLKAAGFKFVVRYLSTPGNPKNITKAELADLHAHGIDVALVFETTGDTFLGGHAAGVRDARLAQEQVAALGVPNAVVYFAIDRDPHGHETTIVDYIHGASQTRGYDKTGVYGGLNAVKACATAKVCKFFWQAYAWSYGKWYAGNHLEQYSNGQHIDGHSVDLDRAKKRSYGAL